MKVDPSLVNNPSVGQRKTAANSGNAGAAAYGNAALGAQPAPTSVASGSHRVHLSPAAAQMMASANNDSGDIDTAKVSAIRAALANGTYRTDSPKIADGMLQGSREMLRKPV